MSMNEDTGSLCPAGEVVEHVRPLSGSQPCRPPWGPPATTVFPHQSERVCFYVLSLVVST